MTFSYDFPGPATLGARLVDDRGGLTITNLPVNFVTDPTEVLTLCGAQPDRTFKLCMLGQTNGTYVMLASTNLNTTNWLPLGPLEHTNGIWRFIDTDATNYPRRFYRVRLE